MIYLFTSTINEKLLQTAINNPYITHLNKTDPIQQSSPVYSSQPETYFSVIGAGSLAQPGLEPRIQQ